MIYEYLLNRHTQLFSNIYNQKLDASANQNYDKINEIKMKMGSKQFIKSSQEYSQHFDSSTKIYSKIVTKH